ncbi:MAG: hypothetical protein Sylvanvirus10_1, partial [Sylvanvirus sp.]
QSFHMFNALPISLLYTSSKEEILVISLSSSISPSVFDLFVFFCEDTLDSLYYHTLSWSILFAAKHALVNMVFPVLRPPSTTMRSPRLPASSIMFR